jgi:hypothetical protein
VEKELSMATMMAVAKEPLKRHASHPSSNSLCLRRRAATVLSKPDNSSVLPFSSLFTFPLFYYLSAVPALLSRSLQSRSLFWLFSRPPAYSPSGYRSSAAFPLVLGRSVFFFLGAVCLLARIYASNTHMLCLESLNMRVKHLISNIPVLPSFFSNLKLFVSVFRDQVILILLHAAIYGGYGTFARVNEQRARLRTIRIVV